METYKVTEENERLDQIVYEIYGSLDYFSQVQSANPQLLNVFLTKGDMVYMPPKNKTEPEDVLW